MSEDDRPAWWARAQDPWAAPPSDAAVSDEAVDAPVDAPISAPPAPFSMGPPPPAAPEPSPYDAVYGSAYPAPDSDLTAPYAYPSEQVSKGTGSWDGAGRRAKPRSGPGWLPLTAGALGIALLAGLLGGVVATQFDDTRTNPNVTLGTVVPGDRSRSADSVAGIADRVLPTVVSIEVRAGGSGGTGSGFILTEDGYLLTNNHVVASAASGGNISVTFNDGSTERAEIVGRTSTYDLAVLKVDRTGLPVAELGNSDSVVVGDAAIAVGSPLGLSGTVTSGIISAIDRPVTAGDGSGGDISFIAALQTDAAINPGNSGGPLVDSKARVIGVNSAIASLGVGAGSQAGSIGLGFSIPINQARRTAEQLIRTGTASYPIIGASLDPTYTGSGVRIAPDGVTAGGPADQVGLRAGDVIVEFDGQPVAGPDELIVAIRARVPGDEVTLTVDRGGSEETLQITLGEATD